MKKLAILTGVIALGIAFGFAGGAGADPAGPHPHESDSDSTESESSSAGSEFSSPLVVDGVAQVFFPGDVSSSGKIDNLGHWEVETTDLPVLTPTHFAICLAGKLNGDEFNPPVFLDNPQTNGSGDLVANGDIAALDDGDWQGLRFQIRENSDPSDPNCTEPLVQESGLTMDTDGSGLSKFSAPFVVDGLAQVIFPNGLSSTGEINDSGDWLVATTNLEGKQKYDICLVGMHDGMEEDPPLFLSDLKSSGSGNLYAKGNAVNRGGAGDWQGLRFQIMEDSVPNCMGLLVQESGITIEVPL